MGSWGVGSAWVLSESLNSRFDRKARPHVIAYRATLDVPRAVLRTVTRWIDRVRHAPGRLPQLRAGSSRDQAILVLRWMANRTRVRVAARDAGVSRATGYRYLQEAIDIVAGHAKTLGEVIAIAIKEGQDHLALDGTLIPIDRVAERNTNGFHRWYSGKHRKQGGSVQVLTDATGYPIWISPVEPGSVHDITAARRHVFPTLNHAAATQLPVYCDRGYRGADIGYRVPVQAPNLDRATRDANWHIAATRACAERGNALLKHWRALDRVTLDPNRITAICRCALVLTHLRDAATQQSA